LIVAVLHPVITWNGTRLNRKECVVEPLWFSHF
jgi:hypothetical protein